MVEENLEDHQLSMYEGLMRLANETPANFET